MPLKCHGRGTNGDRIRFPVMGWSGRAPAPPAIGCWEGAPKTRSTPCPRSWRAQSPCSETAVLLEKPFDLLARKLGTHSAPVGVIAVVSSRQEVGFVGNTRCCKSPIEGVRLFSRHDTIA